MPIPVRSAVLLILVSSLFWAGCSILDPGIPYAGTYTATKWTRWDDLQAPPGTDEIAHGRDLNLTLNENRTAFAHVSTLDPQEASLIEQPVGSWKTVGNTIIVTWDGEDELYLPLPDLELQANKDGLEGGGTYPCCLGRVQLVLVRN